jgi:hypothetical protein
MPQQVYTTVENNFTKGLITEATGLNFPENAATDTDNCVYTLIGDVTRRQGIDFEDNFGTNFMDIGGSALNTYKWNNVGGDGETQLLVVASGIMLSFFMVSNNTVTNPLSKNRLNTTIDISAFSNQSNPEIQASECTFADGNGYLFVYHPACDPFYCVYSAGKISANHIDVQIRDFIGVVESGSPAVNSRPLTLTDTHLYNLTNQGWTQGNPWVATSSTNNPNIEIGNATFIVQSGIANVTNGQIVNVTTLTNTTPGGRFIPAGTSVMNGTVTSYSGTSLNVNIFSIYQDLVGEGLGPYQIEPIDIGFINTWNSDVGNYPSNADVWWYFKDSSGVYDPATTANNVSLNSGTAPQGHYILNAWSLQRTLASGISGMTDVITTARPRIGAWFSGRVWYSGVDGSQVATGNADFYTWSSNIYFSQIVESPKDFGNCYQINDPTSEQLFGEIATDGGVISIPEAGAIFKLFPIANGMLVFAANGVWFITGSQGIGFDPTDYTITKISSVQSIASTSYVDVLGLPFFWNEDGIYSVTQSQNGSLGCNPLTVGTIETFYDSIPFSSKQLARGAYHPIDYIIQWVFKDTEATSIDDSYSFNRILCYNTYNKAFYTYTVPIDKTSIKGINYITGPGGLDTTPPVFKYFAVKSDNQTTSFADEHDETYLDWTDASGGENYISYFVTGFKLRGQGIKKFQPTYIQMYSRTNGVPTAYKIQGIWDYANSPNSGRYSTQQVVTNALTRYDTIYRRHKIRGHGYALQFKLESVDGMPFDIQGWATEDTVNQMV